jgi:hypothetical protein
VTGYRARSSNFFDGGDYQNRAKIQSLKVRPHNLAAEITWCKSSRESDGLANPRREPEAGVKIVT